MGWLGAGRSLRFERLLGSLVYSIRTNRFCLSCAEGQGWAGPFGPGPGRPNGRALGLLDSGGPKGVDATEPWDEALAGLGLRVRWRQGVGPIP